MVRNFISLCVFFYDAYLNITFCFFINSFLGMMAMFSVKFAYKLSSTMFTLRPSLDKKTYYSDLLPAVCDRIEYCLVKHLLFLLDKFGLSPSLRDTLDFENELERNIVIVFAAYHKELVPSVLYEKIIEDEDRELDALISDADRILDEWDTYFRSSHSSRSLGIAWPLKHGDVKGLPPIAYIIMAWGFYIGDRFRKIEDYISVMMKKDPTMNSEARDLKIIQNESLNLSRIFKGAGGKTILFRQIKRTGTHVWGRNVNDSSCETAEVGSFDCFEILSTKSVVYNLLDFASKLLQPTEASTQFDCSSFVHETSKIETFKVESEQLDGEEAIQFLSPGVFQKTWNDEDLKSISQGRIPEKAAKCPKLTLRESAASHIVAVMNMRKSTGRAELPGLIDSFMIGYGSSNCEVQLVNMIKIQRFLSLDDEQMFDINAYKVLHSYCGMKKYRFHFPPVDSATLKDNTSLKTAFLTYFPKVKHDLHPVLRDFSSGKVVHGSVSTNIRKRDRADRTPKVALNVQAVGNRDSDDDDEEYEWKDDEDHILPDHVSKGKSSEDITDIDGGIETNAVETIEGEAHSNDLELDVPDDRSDMDIGNIPVDDKSDMDVGDIPVEESPDNESSDHVSDDNDNSLVVTVAKEKSPKKRKPRKKKAKKN